MQGVQSVDTRLMVHTVNLLREKLEEDVVSYFQNFHDASESSDDSTNVVNAPREPFVVKQDHGVKSSRNPPPIDECCCECGNALDGIFCQQCICKSCGKGAHIGYNCSPKVPIISNPEPCNQTINNEPPQTLPTFDPPKFNHYSVFETPKVLLLAWDRVFKIKDVFGNKQYKPDDIQELFRKLFNTPGWNCLAFYNNGDDDDVDYTIAITPVLSTEEPDNSLSMGDEHLDTILKTKSDEVIKFSVEDLVPILSESKGIPDTMCDAHLVNNPTPLEAKDHFKY
nr:hypothetical protein [Tanacetum cinerariifolium]